MVAVSQPGIDQTRLAAARLLAAEAQPFLAVALYALTPIADSTQPTFAVDDKWRLLINPAKLNEWSVREVAGVLLHEVSHVVRDHAGRARTVGVHEERARYLWNLAADAEINDDLRAAKVQLPHPAIFAKTLHLPAGKVAEFYYSRLSQRRKPPDLPAIECGSGCHGRSEDNAPTWTLDPVPPGLTDAEALLLRRRVAEAILISVGKQPGQMPGGWARWAEALLRGRVDWKLVLNSAIRSAVAAVAGASDYSYRRPARRQVPGVVLPAMHRPLPKIAIIVDTSGSVDEALLQQAWTEVHGCLRALGARRDLLTVFAADVTAHRLKGPPRRQISLIGGGGTNMTVAIETALRPPTRPDLVVVITDGLTPWPQRKPTRPIIVALLPTSLKRPATPAWARTVEIPREDGAASDRSSNDGGTVKTQPRPTTSRRGPGTHPNAGGTWAPA